MLSLELSPMFPVNCVPIAARTGDLNSGFVKNFCLAEGPPKKMDFFSPHPSQRYVFSFQRLFEFLNLIRN